MQVASNRGPFSNAVSKILKEDFGNFASLNVAPKNRSHSRRDSVMEPTSNRGRKKKTKINYADIAEIYNIQDGKIFENIEVLKTKDKEIDFKFLQDSIKQIKIFSDLSFS